MWTRSAGLSVGSVAGVVGAAAAIVFGLLPFIRRRKIPELPEKDERSAAGPSGVLLPASEHSGSWQVRRAAYLATMARLARALPEPLQVVRRGPPLITAYVRRLPGQGEPAERARNERNGEPLAGGSPVGGRLPSAQIMAEDGDCWLIGSPGSGKSRLLRSWTADLADQPPGAVPAHLIPIFFRAADLASVMDSPIGRLPAADCLAAAVNLALRSAGIVELPWLAKFFGTPVPGDNKWLILADALDEIPNLKTRRSVLGVLSEMRRRLTPRCRVVVSSRPGAVAEGTSWPGDRYELLPFDEAQRAELSRAWLAELGVEDPVRAARDLAAEIARRGLFGIAQIPLMLVILVQLFDYHDANLPADRAEVYEQIVEEIGRQDNRGAQPGTPGWLDPDLPGALDALRGLLGGPDGLISRLAFERHLGQAQNAVEWAAERTGHLRRRTKLTKAQWNDVVCEALRGSRLLVAQGDDFAFAHASLGEFFAARHLARNRRMRAQMLRFSFGHRTLGVRYYPAMFLSDLPRQLTGAEDQDDETSLTYWLYAFWRDWAPFTRALRRCLRRDPLRTAAFIAELAWRGVPLDQRLRAATRDRLAAAVEAGRGQPDEKRLVAAAHLAMLGDSRGLDELAAAVGDPGLGWHRLDVAETLTALGDPRGADLFAEATKAVVTAPVSVTEAAPYSFNDEMMTRRLAAGELARRGHPTAYAVLKTILTDDRFDARTRWYTYGMLADSGDRHSADLFARLVAEIPSGHEREAHYRGVGISRLARMTDPGSADRLAVIVSASAMVPRLDRQRAAVRLAELGDPRAADLLADFALEGDADVRLVAAWALAGLGDHRAVGPLVELARPEFSLEWHSRAGELAGRGHPEATDVLAAVAAEAALPILNRCAILQWLILFGDSRAIKQGSGLAADPSVPVGYLFRLADALARSDDLRFTALLRAWTARREKSSDGRDPAADGREHNWAARVIGSPERLLGDGLFADRAAARELGPHARLDAIYELFDTYHPLAARRLAALARDVSEQGPTWVRDQAVDLLASHRDPAAAPYLRDRIRGLEPDDSRRTDAIRALTELHGPGVADILADLAPSLVRDHERFLVAHNLEACGDPRLGEILARWLPSDRNPSAPSSLSNE